MAVDRGYGSGKPMSAAQSAARRAAAGKAASRKKTIQKQAANPGVRLGVSRVGKTENAGFNIGGRKYLETGVSSNKLLQVAKSLFGGGQKGGLNWGPSVTFENPFRGLAKAPKVKELDWGPRAPFVRTSSKRLPDGRGPLNWGPSNTFENPFKRTPKAPKPKKLKW